MSDSKPWWLSAGVWGAGASLVASGLSLFKIKVDPALLNDLQQWVLSLAGLIGGGVALWGRLRATRRVRSALTPTALRLLPLGFAFYLTGCTALQAPQGPYLAADRATFDAITPEYGDYVSHDSSIDVAERDRRLRTIETWQLRLETAESTAK